jgi:3-oxoacyl-[acyl-carrier-protein] synthase-3
MRSDGSGGELLVVPAGGSRYPPNLQTVYEGQHYIQMNGREVYRFATRVMSQATQEAVCRCSTEDGRYPMDYPHQANQRIIEAARNLEFPMERVIVNLDRYGTLRPPPYR